MVMPLAFFIIKNSVSCPGYFMFYTELKFSFSVSATNLIVDYIEFEDCFGLFQYILSTSVLTSKIIGVCLERRE